MDGFFIGLLERMHLVPGPILPEYSGNDPRLLVRLRPAASHQPLVVEGLLDRGTVEFSGQEETWLLLDAPPKEWDHLLQRLDRWEAAGSGEVIETRLVDRRFRRIDTLLAASPPLAERYRLKLSGSDVFGSGSHPTTRLLARHLETIEQPGTVVDVGCGTGILGLIAVRLGARLVVAVDVDMRAAATTLANARANGASNLLVAAGTVECLNLTADLVLANLPASVLLHTFPSLVHKLAPGGLILVSGFQSGSSGTIRATAEKMGLALAWEDREGPWYAHGYLASQRPASSRIRVSKKRKDSAATARNGP